MSTDPLRFGIGTVVHDLPQGPGVIRSFTREKDGPTSILVDHEGTLRRYTWAELLAAGWERAARSERIVNDRPAPLLAELTEQEQRRYKRWYADLGQIETGSRARTPEHDREMGLLDPAYDPLITSQEDRIQRKQHEIRARTGSSAPSRATIMRDLKTLRDEGIDGLIHRSRRTMITYVRDQDSTVVDRVAQTLRENKPQGKTSLKMLAAIARADLTKHDLGDALTHYQLERLVKEISRGSGLQYEAKARQRHGIKPVRVYGGRPLTRIGEVVQVDANRVNIHCLSDDGRTYLPSTVATAVDVRSRCVVAVRIAVGAVTGRDVGLLLWDLTKPNVARVGWPYELDLFHGRPRLVEVNHEPAELDPESRARAFVQPAAIVVDRGSENVNLDVLNIAARNATEVILAPPGAGYAKGIIESLFNHFDALAQLLPGYRGAAVANHAKGVEGEAALGIGDFLEAVWAYVDVYHRTPHSGLEEEFGKGTTPQMVYQDEMRAGAYVEVAADPYAYIHHLSSERRTLHDDGIRLHNLVYSSTDLVALRRYVQAGTGARARKLTVRFDRADLSRIFVRHPADGSWLCIPRRDRAFGTEAPFSELVVRQALDDQDKGGRLTRDELSLALAQVRNRWDSGVFKDRTERRRAAAEQERQKALAADIADADEIVQDLAYPVLEPVAPLPDDEGEEFVHAGPDDDEIFEWDDVVVDMTDFLEDESDEMAEALPPHNLGDAR